MLLQATGLSSYMEQGGVIGLMSIIILALVYVIRLLWNDRSKSRTAWKSTLDAKEKQVEAKDQEIKEIRADDRALIKEVTAAIQDASSTDRRIIEQNDKILDILVQSKSS